MAPTSIFKMMQFVNRILPGRALQDGQTLLDLFLPLFQTSDGLIANPGGGQPNATPLKTGYNRVSTTATAADSVALPYAIVGLAITVFNDGAASLQVMGQIGDTIAAQGAHQSAAVAANVGVAVAAAAASDFVCYTPGIWKQHTY